MGTLLDIINESGFVRMSALLRGPFLSPWWKRHHADVPFWTLWNNFDKASQIPDKDGILAAFVDLLIAVVEADPWRRHTEEDMNWFVKTLGEPDYLTRLAMFKAYVSAPDILYTPAEVAQMTGTSESNWRNKAASGDIPFAVKKGKQWLLSRSVLIMLGVLTREQQIEGILQSEVEEAEAPE